MHIFVHMQQVIANTQLVLTVTCRLLHGSDQAALQAKRDFGTSTPAHPLNYILSMFSIVTILFLHKMSVVSNCYQNKKSMNMQHNQCDFIWRPLQQPPRLPMAKADHGNDRCIHGMHPYIHLCMVGAWLQHLWGVCDL